MRKTTVLHSPWRFSRENDKQIRTVTVPHDWAVDGPFSGWYEPFFDGDGYRPSGATGGLPCADTGYYEYDLMIPANASERCFRLEFDGVMSNAEVSINGRAAAVRHYGYSSFAADITGLVHPGSNKLAVKVTNPPYSSRWYTGAGIFREVRLAELEKQHFSWNGVWLRTSLFFPESGEALLTVEAEGIDPLLLQTTVSRNGRVYGSGKDKISLTGIEAWSPENPVLYEVSVTIPGDEVTLLYGFRKVEFSAQHGMFLNGRLCKFKGLCMHHDLGVFGAAFNKAAARYRLEKIKALGCNAIRTAHNPPDPKFLDLCDELGFLVVDEAFDGWEAKKTAGGYRFVFKEDHRKDLTDFVKRDRNHPCVVLWSIGNEMPEQLLPEGADMAREMVGICHALDPDRPVTASLNWAKEKDDPMFHALAAALDVIGWNYHNRIYPLLHERFPDKPQFGLETAAVYNTRGEYYQPVITGSVRRENMLSSAYACEYSAWSTSSESEFAAQHRYPWLAGEFAWCTFDYLGEPTPYLHDWPSRSSSFGLFDFANLPKDRAWLYAAEWHEKGKPEILHLLPCWEWKKDEEICVQVFSSCHEVELFLNGRSLGRKQRGGFPTLTWEGVIFEPGTLECAGFDNSGNEVARTSRITPGVPVSVVVEMESRLNDNGETIVFAGFFLADAAGNPIEKACEMLSFQEEHGELIGADNGDNRSIAPFKTRCIKLFNGHAAAVFRTSEPEKFTLKAVCGNLTSGAVKIQ